MSAPSLELLLADLRELPALPAAVERLIASLRREDVDVGELANGVAQDQALSARVLRVANSSFYGVRQGVASIHDAIMVLGFRAVSNLVMAASVTGYFRPAGESGLDLEGFWRHSIRAALCARSLARRADLDAEAGFTAGLLHDLGRLLLATTRPAWHLQVQADCDARGVTWVEAERQTLGFDHAQIGEALSTRWHFPPEIVQAVALHHNPNPDANPTLADVTHAADALAHILAAASDSDRMDPRVRALFKLDAAAEMTILGEGDKEYEAYCAMLSV